MRKQAKLQAVIAGLDHLERQMDLPVVVYDMHALKHERFQYVGKGRKELMQVGREVVGAITRDEMELVQLLSPDNYITLCVASRKYFNVDLEIGVSKVNPQRDRSVYRR